MFIWTKLNYFSNINFISPWRQQTQNTQTYKKVQKFKKCFSQKFLKQDIDKITVSIGSFSESEFIIRLFRRTYVNFSNIFGCILGDIAKKWFRINIAVTVLWSVSVSVCLSCLSVPFMHCAETAEDIDTIFLLTTAPCPFQIALNLAYIGRLIPPQILLRWPTPVDLTIGDIRWQIAAEWLQRAQWSQ